MFVVAVFIEANPDNAGELRQALVVHAKRCRELEPLCLKFDVGEDPTDPASFFLYEVYETKAALLAHREMQHYADFRVLADPWIASRKVLTYTLISGVG